MAELLNLGAEGVGFVGFEAVSREGKLQFTVVIVSLNA